MTQIINTVQIDRPPTDVFDYVTAPMNWPEWHPSSVSVDVMTGRSLRVGEQVREAIAVAAAATKCSGSCASTTGRTGG